ncbi:MAG: SulP family inorganic anion transporter [Pirellulaceae bacterium]|nr:SulP family inorganic anion transporter [Pirellulaceae bacterium]
MSSATTLPASSADAPAKGDLSGFFKYFRFDVLSGFLVFLIALPLCLGISSASEYPIVAGVLTAIVGACITPFISNSELTIKGPAAGLIVISLGAIQEMKEIYGDDKGYAAVLAIGVVAGLLQVAFGVFRSGVIGEFFPSAVVHGMLAAIGVIIIGKQTHVLLGVQPKSHDPLGLLAEIPHSIWHLDPYVACIGLISLVLLFGMSFFKNKAIKKIPVPMLVMLIAIPMGMYFELGKPHKYSFGGVEHFITEKALVNIPSSLMSAITFPNFESLQTFAAWKWIAMFALIGTLESILSAKAVDMLDPYRRKSNLNRDLLAVGIGNTVSSAIGGLPMISEIVRSKANIDNGAKTRFANMWHGLFLLVSVAYLGSFIHLIPMTALAAMLIFTGFRLASPNEFLKVYRTGREQLFIFVFTMLMVLATDLLVGIMLGIVAKLVIHTANGVPITSLFKPFLEVENREDGSCTVFASQSAVFSNWIPFRRQIEHLGLVQHSDVTVDLSGTQFVDHTVMEKLHELQEDFTQEGLKLEIVGLDSHQQMSNSSFAARKRAGVPLMHRLTFTMPESLESTVLPLIRQNELQDIVKSNWKSVLPNVSNENLFRIEVLVARDKSQRIIESVRRSVTSLTGMTMLLETVGVIYSESEAWIPGSNGSVNEFQGVRDDFVKKKHE